MLLTKSMFITTYFRALLKAAVIVVPVLGCTWVFGLLAVNEDTVVFAWIFTILNSLQVYHILLCCLSVYINVLQGMLIMFFYVLRDEKVHSLCMYI